MRFFPICHASINVRVLGFKMWLFLWTWFVSFDVYRYFEGRVCLSDACTVDYAQRIRILPTEQISHFDVY